MCLLLFAGISSLYALSQIQFAKDAENKKQQAENKVTRAEANYNQVTQSLKSYKKRTGRDTEESARIRS